ncbi:uncharacterized protein LOC135202888 [Macrobrachium nipponense]|uniref:uncharacterized protein LOC135202888 n=1 Tax=Macrobrachium nipponense TaxID=159736 RepID=UPI0030C8BE6D
MSAGEKENFEVSVGLHQGSALSPFLFVLVMDTLIEKIRNEELWELLYADDLVITAKIEEDLKRGGLKMNVNKTEVLVSSREDRGRIVMQERRGSVIKQVEKGKYLGSTLSQVGGCETEVDSRIKVVGEVKKGSCSLLKENTNQDMLVVRRSAGQARWMACGTYGVLKDSSRPIT